MSLRRRVAQIVIILVVQSLTLLLLQAVLPGLVIVDWAAALLAAAVLILAQLVYWWVFVNFLSWLPVWLYPLATFAVSGVGVLFFGNLLPGIQVDGFWTGLWITLVLTGVNAILGGLLALDVDEKFDQNVTRPMVRRRSKPVRTDVPGFLFLEIDGLGEALLRKAVTEGYMPNLKRWIDKGTHQIMGWETEFSSQTGAMQTGILLGNNDDVPAYRWWDRQTKKIVMSGLPNDAQAIEARLSNGRGLCSDGGASRGNMFSGDGTESMLTFSTLKNRSRGRGPGFYSYLVSPYVVARLVTRFQTEVIKEWYESIRQRLRKDPYRVSARNPGYAFLRAFMGPVLQDLITFTVISDILRGIPAVYALYAGYDDLSHFAGMESEEAFEALHEIDRYFGRIERAIAHAPRPYHIIALSDHGQTLGLTFQNAHGMSLEEVVKGLVTPGTDIFYTLVHNEAWDDLNALVSESTDTQERTADLVRRMVAGRQRGDHLEVGPQDAIPDEVEAKAREVEVVVFGSGSTGLVYFTAADRRLAYEQINDAHPELIMGLINHPGIGFVLVRTEQQGDIVIGKSGIHYLDDDHVDGIDPLAVFGPHAATHLRRESSFSNCPDLVVSSVYDPQTETMCGFENQVSHHGGLGGPQNHPFFLRPTALPYDGKPVVGATSLYRLLRNWRAAAHGIPPAAESEKPAV